MNTEIIKLNNLDPDLDKLKRAAAVLRQGGLVAFPTETVYGLGANALNGAAVKNIFVAKGRPSDNPLIVHISDTSMLLPLVTEIPPIADKLIAAFWPGPLTLIFKKSALVPAVITAGLDTVAIRMPSHPVALKLIELADIPVAAPSANTSGRPSPTRAGHVIEDLMGRIDMIIDAGNAEVGLESTVLDLTSAVPMILRPGGVSPEQLKIITGSVSLDPTLTGLADSSMKPKAPGMKYRHYSPKAEVLIVDGKLEKIVENINRLVMEYASKGKKVGVLATKQTCEAYKDAMVICSGDRESPKTVAAGLFAAFREFDEHGVEIILAEAIDSTGIGLAVMNRMRKAAGNSILKV